MLEMERTSFALYALHFALGFAAQGFKDTVQSTGECNVLEPKGNATWLMRDARSMISLNHTVIVATSRNIVDGVTVCRDQELTATTNSLGEISFLLPQKNGPKLSVTFEAAGYHPITVSSVQLDQDPDSVNTFMEPLLFIHRRFTGSGTATGSLRDFSNYTALVGVRLEFRSDMNNHTGTAVKTIATSADGTWNVTLPGGHYTMTASKSGYITQAYTVVIIDGESREHGVTGLSPHLVNGSIRIVSLGGDASKSFYPMVHIEVPVEGKTEGTHNFFMHITRGSFVVYDFTSWEIQSAVIVKQLAGVYRISVAQWLGIGKPRARTPWDMAYSGVTLQLYTGNKVWAQYFVPNRMGNTWIVVEINGSHLKAINEMRTVPATDVLINPLDS